MNGAATAAAAPAGQTATPAQTVALLGCGAMGRRMGLRLLAAGHRLRVYNRSPGAALEGLQTAGAVVCGAPAVAALGADAVLCMVTDDAAAQRMWWAEDGAVAALPAQAQAVLWLECSTLSVRTAAAWQVRASQAGVCALAAPVLGSLPQAEAGQLVALPGGSADAMQRAMPLLEVLSARQVLSGSAAQAMLLKLMVNSFLAVQAGLLGEWLAAAAAEQVDMSNLWPLLAELPVFSPALRLQAQLMLEDRHAPLFPVALVAKDLGYAVQAAGVQAGITIAAASRFAELVQQGAGALNISAVGRLV